MALIKSISYPEDFLKNLIRDITNSINKLKTHDVDFDDINLSIPMYLIHILQQNLDKNATGLDNFLSSFKTTQINYHFTNEVVIWHKDTPFLQKEWMVEQLPLSNYEI
jgi:hypothetical protein